MSMFEVSNKSKEEKTLTKKSGNIQLTKDKDTQSNKDRLAVFEK